MRVARATVATITATMTAAITASVVLTALPAQAAGLKAVSLGFSQALPQSRWLYEKNPTLSKNKVHVDLYKMKDAIRDKHYKTCIVIAARLWKSAPVARPWILTHELLCRHRQFQKDRIKELNHLDQFLSRVYTQNKVWLLSGPQADLLRERFLDASVDVFAEQVGRNRRAGWATAFRLAEFSDELKNTDRARLYKWMGELAFAEQNLSAALDYFERSLAVIDQSDVRKKVALLRKELRRMDDGADATPKPLVQESRAGTEEEQKLFDRFRATVQSRDYVSAVEDGVELISQFPGSRRSDQAAKQIQSIYLALADSSDEKIQLIKGQVVATMKKCDGQRLYDWAQLMASREYFQDALALGGDSLKLVGGQPVSTQILLLVAQASLHAGEFDLAVEYFQQLQQKHSGTAAAAESFFRLGLIYYRQQKYSEAALMFEKYLSQDFTLGFKSDFEVSSRYWLWRARQKTKSDTADEARESLIASFPLSYYGLRARLERDKGKLSLPKANQPKKWKLKLWLTPDEAEAWDRVFLFIGGNWFQEAQAELARLPVPKEPEMKVVMARLWAAALDYYHAFDLIQQAWDGDRSLVNDAVVELLYPHEFLKDLKAESKRYNVPVDLMLSLIRQESSFRTKVDSPAGARGLMQLMRPTANEVAHDLRIRNFSADPDLYEPAINIRIGSNYLYRLLRAFDGNVPLGLAAYNAGIGNMRGWMKSRTDLDFSKLKGKDPDEELWFDELPWLETSGYIKKILRNLIIYKALDQREGQLSFPIWLVSP